MIYLMTRHLIAHFSSPKTGARGGRGEAGRPLVQLAGGIGAWPYPLPTGRVRIAYLRQRSRKPIFPTPYSHIFRACQNSVPIVHKKIPFLPLRT
jgi:hypothetical protein